MRKPVIPPALALFALSPAIGELLSGSSPPAEFFNPINFLLLACLYGSGAVVVRELKVKWRKDYRAILLLGAAYGIIEEGLTVASFFNPNWMDLGILGSFGRMFEVNWVWAGMLTIYHSVFSIMIPIVLIELTYPSRELTRWTSDHLLKGIIALFIGTVITEFYLFSLLGKYVPPAFQYIATMLIVCFIIFLTYKLNSEKEGVAVKKIGKPRKMYVIGLVGSTSFFLLFWSGPHIFNNPVIILLLGIVLVFGMLKYMKRFNWKGSNSYQSRLAVIAGALSFLIFLAFIQELDRNRVDNTTGMVVVGLISAVSLLLLRSRLKKMLSTAATDDKHNS